MARQDGILSAGVSFAITACLSPHALFCTVNRLLSVITDITVENHVKHVKHVKRASIGLTLHRPLQENDRELSTMNPVGGMIHLNIT